MQPKVHKLMSFSCVVRATSLAHLAQAWDPSTTVLSARKLRRTYGQHPATKTTSPMMLTPGINQQRNHRQAISMTLGQLPLLLQTLTRLRNRQAITRWSIPGARRQALTNFLTIKLLGTNKLTTHGLLSTISLLHYP